MIMGITSSSVLVELNISVWTANKLDRNETDKVTITNNAGNGAAKVHKNLMAGTSLRRDIANFAAICRARHNELTLPWADRGGRLLPTSLFLEYKTEYNTYRDKFNAMVDDFIDKYPMLVQTAQNYMGSLFNPDDYPSADVVRSAFDFRLVFSPVPESGDFRLNVSANDLTELAQQYESNFTERMADAMREPWDRLHKLLTGMSEKLTDQEGKDKRYHDSLVDNAVTLCGMLTHLNITNDPKLEQARQQLESALVGASMDMIKESAVVRADMKGKVDSILKQFEW
jgi:hypothetical protein